MAALPPVIEPMRAPTGASLKVIEAGVVNASSFPASL
jgi:hypothetical protein